jgi:hypothetical protein
MHQDAEIQHCELLTYQLGSRGNACGSHWGGARFEFPSVLR